jgi:YidC/Oxa1 family membrane protein insertase
VSTEKRLIIAVALSLGVVLLFGYLYERGGSDERPRPPAPAAAVTAETAAPGAAAAAPVAPAATPAAPALPAATAPAPAAPEVAAAGPLAPTEPPPETRESFENAEISVSVSSRRGRITTWRLRDPRYTEEDAGEAVPLDLASVPPGILGLHCYDSAAPEENRKDVCPDDYVLSRDGDTVILIGIPRPGALVSVRQRYEFGVEGNPFTFRRTVTLEPATPGVPVRNLVLWTWVSMFEPLDDDSGGWLSPKLNGQNGLCRIGGDLQREERSDVGANWREYGSLDYVGVETTYFLSAFGFENRIPPDRRDFCVLDVLRTGERAPLRASLQFAPMDLTEQRTHVLVGYLGPKSLDRLRDVPALSGLDEAIDYGWFSPISLVMLRVLQFFHGLVGSWGVAIILLTVLVKLLLLPLTHWSTMSMRRMAAVKPLLDEINEKYKEDKQRKNQALMDLYKTHKINPLSGCFPLLLQMPIWIALYRMLGNSAELYHTPFLYLKDLTQADPYYILPLVLGVSMFAQQKLTPTTMDSTQAKIMQWFMPILFTVFMLWLPSGLNVYILTNTVLSVVQQQLINRFVPAPVLVAAKGAAQPGAAPAPAAGRTDDAPPRRSRRKR